MSFVKSMDWIAKNHPVNPMFYNAEMLTIYYETNPDVVKKLLPPPLQPFEIPICAVLLANYPKTGFGVSYKESALFLTATHNNEMGSYCLSMQVTNDMALILGREIFGYPKKMAKVKFDKKDAIIEGSAERRGVKFLNLKADLGGKWNDEEAQGLFGEYIKPKRNMVAFNHKFFPAPDNMGFDYTPRLIREEIQFDSYQIEMGKAELNFEFSDHDPWAEVEVMKVLGASYSKGNNTMLPGEIVAEVAPDEFIPYAFMKLDVLSDAD